jgi:hypothetical protein
MRRFNEFGMQIVDSALWPETGKSVVALTDTDHATVLPYLADTLDGAQGAWDEMCHGGDCWNRAWLQQMLRAKFQQLNSFSNNDLSWMVTQILHKVHLNIDLSDIEAQAFADFQTSLINHLPYQRNLLWVLFAGWYPAGTRRDYLETYKAAIQQKWSGENWQAMPEKLTVVASAMLDSMTLLGGHTVPKVLDYLFALMHMNDDLGVSVRRQLDIMQDNRAHIWSETKLSDFIWETLRRFSPVIAVPRWITDDGGLTWQHQIVNVEQAFKDPAVFPDPFNFQFGRPGMNNAESSLSIGCNPADGWAEFEPERQPCLGQELSLTIYTVFLREFHQAGPWTVDNANIGLNSYGSSGWTMRKR